MSPLSEILKLRIARRGAIGVDEYMAQALGHPEHGYYMRKDPLGQAGDFTTAPEISQMFGELLGSWCVVLWDGMGRPDPVMLVELGPGRGTLMVDALRAARSRPEFVAAARLHLVETSPALRDRQRESLAAAHPLVKPHWNQRFEDMADGPLLLIANEFLDALPIRQYVRAHDGWRERRVGLAEDGATLTFVLGETEPQQPAGLPEIAHVEDGSLVEVCPQARCLARTVAQRVRRTGGAALFVDYGHAESAPGETLQSVRRHGFHDVLHRPGEADLTAHVDFAALAAVAEAAGAKAWGPVPQGLFLGRLGIEARAAMLMARATPEQARALMAGLRRLVHPREMGTLFKVFAITDPALPRPPGFEPGR